MGPKIARVLLAVLAFLIGVAVGVLGSFQHRITFTVGSTRLPTGLLLAFGAVIGLVLLFEGLLGPGPALPGRPLPSRLSATACASIGWLFALVSLSYFGPPAAGFHEKGDVILVNDWRSITFLFGGMCLLTVGMYRAWSAALTARIAQASGAPDSPHSNV